LTQTGHDANQVSVDVSGFSGASPAAGVVFYQHANYLGAASQPLAAGNYTASQLIAKGVYTNWASSARVPSGFTVVMYTNDNFIGNSWTLTSDTTNFSALSSPSPNDKVAS